MSYKILDGKKLAEEILRDLQKEIKRKRLRLTLAAIQIGEDPTSQVFVEQKKKACQKIGIYFKSFKFPAKIKDSEFKKEVKKIVKNPLHSGVVIQLPVPKKFEPEEEFTNLIPEEKDVDVLSGKSFMRFFGGSSLILPPVVGGIDFLLKKYRIKIQGRNVVIMGAGKLTGLPTAIWALQNTASVRIINTYTKELSKITSSADILISGVGKPGLIRGNMVKRGVVVIDCGTKRVGKKIKGDVDFKTVAPKASYITPVPGGVGPLTVAMLLWNLVKLNQKN